jgi:drug/metabolite transporter, DME family
MTKDPPTPLPPGARGGRVKAPLPPAERGDFRAIRRSRGLIVAAAALWSLSGLFTKLLTTDTPLGLHEPTVAPLQIAFYRIFLGGLVLVPLLRRADLTFRPLMVAMVASFAVMNVLFVTAMARGSAGNAILLQYTAPLWVTLAGAWLLRERIERRNLASIGIALVGVAVIVAGHWTDEDRPLLAMGLGSGVFYAGVLLGLRLLRVASPVWLTVLNLVGGALVLLPWVWQLPLPSAGQLAFLAFFGAVQMGLPYLLMARGLRYVSSQQAATLTLLEPVLNPLWPWLFLGLAPSPWTLAGGAFILGALAWRYAPVAGSGGNGDNEERCLGNKGESAGGTADTRGG